MFYQIDVRDFIPTKKYSCILADPPWLWATRSPKGRKKSPDRHYKCLSLDEIKALPVSSWTTDNAVLLIWNVDAMLEQTLDVIRSWGFAYKTIGFNWAKTTKTGKWFYGMGHWTRGNPEICLLATKGAPRRKSGGVRKLVVDLHRGHSTKPLRIRDDIMRLVEGPYLELFARNDHPEWDCVGDQLDGGMVPDALPR